MISKKKKKKKKKNRLKLKITKIPLKDQPRIILTRQKSISLKEGIFSSESIIFTLFN